MATLQSPGVAWSEIDLTTIVPSLSTTVGGFAGNFNWGPVNELVTLSNEIDLLNTFGMPDQNTFTSFYTAANFLSYTSNILIVRTLDTSKANNAVSGTVPIIIENKDIYENEYMNLSAPANTGMFAARYPGAIANGLKVSLWSDSSSVAYSSWAYAPNFNGVPGTSNWTAARGGANDEMHIVVVDTLGHFSTTPNTIIERFSYVSKASDATNDDGTSNYYLNVINERSKYIYILHHAQMANGAADTTTWGLTAANTSFSEGETNYTATLSGGADAAPTNGDLESRSEEHTSELQSH